MKNNNSSNKSKSKKGLFSTMPTEFVSLVQEYASTDMEPNKFISYVAEHIQDYKTVSKMSIEKSLLMTEALFYSAVESPKRLYDYSDEEFSINEKNISFIILNVEEILEELKKTDKMPLHREMDCIYDHSLASLVQNMSLIRYYYYQKKGNKSKAKEALIQVLDAAKRNTVWLLSLDSSIVQEYLEENLCSKDVEFFLGLYPFSEPLQALRFNQPFNKDTIWVYEEFLGYLKKLKGFIKNQKELAKVYDYFEKELCDLYIDKITDIDDEIDDLRYKISVLIREKDQFDKKIRQIQRPGIYPDDYIPTPF